MKGIDRREWREREREGKKRLMKEVKKKKD